jgi:hypothetical protein
MAAAYVANCTAYELDSRPYGAAQSAAFAAK